MPGEMNAPDHRGLSGRPRQPIMKPGFGIENREMFGNTVGKSAGETPNQSASVAAY